MWDNPPFSTYDFDYICIFVNLSPTAWPVTCMESLRCYSSSVFAIYNSMKINFSPHTNHMPDALHVQRFLAVDIPIIFLWRWDGTPSNNGLSYKKSFTKNTYPLMTTSVTAYAFFFVGWQERKWLLIDFTHN